VTKVVGVFVRFRAQFIPEHSINSTNTFGKEMKDIDSVEQFIVNELPRILPIIN
jgi:hypothetical protein